MILISVIEIAYFNIPGGPKKMEQNFSYNSGCLVVIIRLLFNSPNACSVMWHQRKRYVIVMYFKMAPQRDNWIKVSALLRAGHKASEVANLVGVTRTTVYAINPIKRYRCCTGGPLSIMGDNYPCIFPICST